MVERKIFQDSVTPLPVQAGLTPSGLMVQAVQPDHRNDLMTLLFSLAIPKAAQDELEARVARGEVISFDEMKKSYSPNPADVDQLQHWLRAQGYQIVRVATDGTGVYAKANITQIEQSLQTRMVRVTKDGLTYTASQNAPSLPADVGKSVHAIIGLQPFRQAHKNSRKRAPKNGNREILPDGGATTAVSTNIANQPPYLVNEILKAYNADGLNVSGRGQTIAILIDAFPANSDLTAFW